jgi:hypothetical protein
VVQEDFFVIDSATLEDYERTVQSPTVTKLGEEESENKIQRGLLLLGGFYGVGGYKNAKTGER